MLILRRIQKALLIGGGITLVGGAVAATIFTSGAAAAPAATLLVGAGIGLVGGIGAATAVNGMDDTLLYSELHCLILDSWNVSLQKGKSESHESSH